MTAIAIPFNNDKEYTSLSRSPVLSFSPSRRYSDSRPSRFAPPHKEKSAPTNNKPVVEPAAQRRKVAAKQRQPVVPLPPVYSGSFIDNFKAVLEGIDLDECDAHGENAFFVCDLAEVYRQHLRWQRELGHRIQPFFAVKCNPDPYVLSLLASLGLGFDCASQPEIAAVLALPNKVDPNRIIYANPCKAPSFVRHAARNGVDYMTFDNGDELAKIKKNHPNAKMVLRILTDDSGSLCRLGLKFGSPLSEVRSLLRKAKALDLDVVGISFHCGSGCKDPELFGDAVKRARWAFDVGAEEGFSFNLLDVGGGFEYGNFEDIAAVLRRAIDKHFPVDQGVRVIAEPGRYYVSKAFELATNIIARRAARESDEDEESDEEDETNSPPHQFDDLDADENAEKPVVMYYINDGVYGAFNCILFDHQVVQPQVLTLGDAFVSHSLEAGTSLEPCSIWGPTCDSIDCVQTNASLPTGQLRVGDWLRWQDMGAYTICAASQFNGFRRSEVRYTLDTRGDSAMETRIRSLLASASAESQPADGDNERDDE